MFATDYDSIVGSKWGSLFLQTGALVLHGVMLWYFGASIPINLIAAVIVEVILVGGAEYY